jgi:predicted 3-demethylubiquinone-9 3-methyltransferase (glyoxalase superfamily)
VFAERDDATDNFVAGHKRISRHAPIVVEHREIAVAEAATFHGDLHLLAAERAGIVFKRLQRLFGARCGEGFDVHLIFLWLGGSTVAECESAAHNQWCKQELFWNFDSCPCLAGNRIFAIFRTRKYHEHMKAKNTICLWFNKDAQDAARFYAATFPDSEVTAIHKAPSDFPDGKEGEILTVEFTVCGLPCVGLNGGPQFKPTEAFSFQIATDTQEETDRYWHAIVSNGGEEKWCGWCKDRWGIFWQITPRALTDAMVAGGAEAKRAFAAMMEMGKIDIAKIEVARRG